MKKIIALTVILLLLKSISFSQNSVLEPEYTSFEPFEAPDMVSLLTGDFTYNLPLLSLPVGNGSNFPVSMAYHAGIPVDMEASWVGLGWNINTGAINRTLNGTPDDWKMKTTNTFSYKKGKSIDYYNVFLNIGIKKIFGVGLSYGWGSYKSFSGSISYMGMGINGGYFDDGENVTSDMGISVSSGFLYAQMNSKGDASIGINYGVGSLDFDIMESELNNSFIDVGISSSSKGSEGNSGIRSLEEERDINLYFFGFYEYHLDWYYFTSLNQKRFGTIYRNYSDILETEDPDSYFYKYFMEHVSTDFYTNPSSPYYHFIPEKNEKHSYFSMPAYDNYSVLAQGISGNINIRNFELASLFEGNKSLVYEEEEVELNYINKYSSMKDPDSELHFTFDGLNGGMHVINNVTNVLVSGGTIDGISYDGGDLETEYNGKSNYDPIRKYSTDGRFTEWFTNRQISNGIASSLGFISDKTVSRPHLDADGIGGIKIIAIDGKTYHFSIPVHQYEMISVSESKEKPLEEYKESAQRDPYAYTWLLTAITGPDYLDDGDDVLNESDYGYWVKFNYGEWTDGYIWKNPYEGYQEYYGVNFRNYTVGRKQIYYLNSIESRTHIAYFLKDIREDGLGFNAEELNKTISRENVRYKVEVTNPANPLETGIAEFDVVTTAKMNFSVPEKHKKMYLSKIVLKKKDGSNTNYCANSNFIETDYVRLEYDNFAIQSGTPRNHWAWQPYAVNQLIDEYRYRFLNFGYFYFQDKILDIYDVDASFYDDAINIIDFSYNYSLCEGTPSSGASNKGKLTLETVSLKGNGGADVLPPYVFGYNNNPNYNSDYKDNWGFYTGYGNANNNYLNKDLAEKNKADAWSLNKVVTPNGGVIDIEYESDSYDNVIVGNDIYKITSFEWLNSTEIVITFSVNDETKIEDIRFATGGKYRVKFGSYAVHFDKMLTCKGRFSGFNKYKFSLGGSSSIPTQDAGAYSFAVGGPKRRDIYYGGGIRVKEIAFSDINNKSSEKYYYNVPGIESKSSGITSYTPNILHLRYIPYINDIPGPMVMYEHVKKESYNYDDELVSTSVFNFNTLTRTTSSLDIEYEIGDFFRVEELQNNVVDINANDKAYLKSFMIHDKTNKVGLLNSVYKYDSRGEVVYSKINKYSSDLVYGTTQETYNTIKDENKDGVHTYYVNFSSKKEYPLKLVEEEITGTNSELKKSFTNFDYITGKAQTVVTENELNNKSYKTDVIAAYEVYSNMGSKVENPNNKNMLSQQTASLSYIKDGPAWKPIGVNVQTWYNTWNYRDYNTTTSKYEDTETPDVWRKHKQFIWKGDVAADGTYSSDFDTYDTPNELATNWANLETVNDKWQQVNEITRYNHYSMPLESKDINGHYVSSKMDIKHEKTIASAANAAYGEFTYTGFENGNEGSYVDGEVNLLHTSVNPNDTYAHTGAYSFESGSFSLSKYIQFEINLAVNRYTEPYKVSFWAFSLDNPNIELKYTFYDVSGNILNTKTKSILYSNGQEFGDWKLFNEFTPTREQITNIAQATKLVIELNVGNGGHHNIAAYFDDFRVHPIDAPMQSYVYDQHTGAVTAILDNNNIATKYEYDDAGKLKRVYKEVPSTPAATGGFIKVSEHDYGYARPVNPFVLVNPSVNTPQVPCTGKRKVTITAQIQNTDIVQQSYNVSCSLNGSIKKFSGKLDAGKSRNLSAYWDVDAATETTMEIIYSGDINHSETVTVPQLTPAVVNFLGCHVIGNPMNMVLRMMYDYQGEYPGFAMPLLNVYRSATPVSYVEGDEYWMLIFDEVIGIDVNSCTFYLDFPIHDLMEPGYYYAFVLKEDVNGAILCVEEFNY